MDSLLNFIQENRIAGGLTTETAIKIEQLWNKYKLPKLEQGCSIISADFGVLGSLSIRRLTGFDEAVEFKYESGNYDYVSVKANQTTIFLWTDYKDIEPYNRNGGLYGDGSSFDFLGKPVIEKDDYREFISRSEHMSNISFAVWGYSFNNFYNTVRFGLCIKTDKVEEFLISLRTLIGKKESPSQ
ncbi:hypothetical protein [Rufibacter soli]